MLGRLIPSVGVKMKLWAMLDRMNLKPINDGEDRREDLSRIPEEMLESAKGEILSLQAVRNYESLSYVVDKNYADRPLGRWLMQQILRMRYRRARRHLGRTEG